jgi:isochorismate pyruvate lyase
MSRRRAFSGAPWEPVVGYCRAIRVGNRILVSGTAPVAEDGSAFAPGDGYAQTKRCIEIIEAAITELGGALSDVVRTRMFVTDVDRWDEYGQAHGDAFGAFPPATAMVGVARLIDPDWLIEIEAEAVVAGY